jgi:hypothetical protein
MLEGMRIISCKFISGLPAVIGQLGLYNDCISLVSGGATGDLIIANNSFEQFTGTAIKGRQSGGAYAHIIITGNQIQPIQGGQIGIDLNGSFNGVLLANNWGYTGFSPQPFITLTGCSNVINTGNAALGYSAVFVQSGCTFAPITGGVPSGGTTGQSLKKVSNANYDVQWA